MLDQLVSFPLNVVFVASNGDIGYAMTGLHPQRKHNVVHGVYPKKGWLKENQWVGLINNKLLPRVLNPKAGYIVSANNLITSSNTKFGISHSFSFPHRFLRIRELLQEKIREKTKLNY